MSVSRDIDRSGFAMIANWRGTAPTAYIRGVSSKQSRSVVSNKCWRTVTIRFKFKVNFVQTSCVLVVTGEATSDCKSRDCGVSTLGSRNIRCLGGTEITFDAYPCSTFNNRRSIEQLELE